MIKQWWFWSEEARYKELGELWSEDGHPLAANSMLARAARLYPERSALEVAPDVRYTYQQLYASATQVSHLLARMQIGRGSRVIIIHENGPLFYSAYHGAWQTGATVIPLNVFLHETEVAKIIHDAQPTALFISRALEVPLAPHIPSSVQIITQDLLETVMAEESVPPFEVVEHAPDETSVILYTSGTTGMPKGVMYSSGAIITNVRQGLARFDFSEDERVLCPLPLFHSFTQMTCVWGSVLCGAAVILVPKITRSSITAALALQPTIIVGIPPLYGLLCRLKGVSLATVRYCVSGGDPLPYNIRRAVAWRFGKKVSNGYGLTETGPMIAADVDDYIFSTHTVGRPVIDMQCELRDATDGIGILWVKGPNVMQGYYKAPEATARVIQDGWLNTGDLGMIDQYGNIVLCGRERDLIVNKGVKIYPQEVETVLTNHPHILLAAVVGEHDDTDGDYPVAYLQCADGTPTTIDALRTWCQDRLAPYKVPRKFYWVEKMPMTTTGKINKKELVATAGKKTASS